MICYIFLLFFNVHKFKRFFWAGRIKSNFRGIINDVLETVIQHLYIMLKRRKESIPGVFWFCDSGETADFKKSKNQVEYHQNNNKSNRIFPVDGNINHSYDGIHHQFNKSGKHVASGKFSDIFFGNIQLVGVNTNGDEVKESK